MSRFGGRLLRLERLAELQALGPGGLDAELDRILGLAVEWVEGVRRQGLDPRAVLDAGEPLPDGVDRDAVEDWLAATEPAPFASRRGRLVQ